MGRHMAEEPRTPEARAALDLLRLAPDETYGAIAEAVGLTRERIRQIDNRFLNGTGLMRRKLRSQQRQLLKVRRPIDTPAKFVLRVNEWLREIGYWYCSHCRRPRLIEENYHYRCRLCNREHVKQFAASDRGKECVRQRQQSAKYKEYHVEYQRRKRSTPPSPDRTVLG